MATEHRDIPDAERHEPKGIATAANGQVYRSNGAASGVWKDDVVCFNGLIDDVSTASFIIIAIPVDCIITSIKCVLANAITLADSTLTVTRGGGASLGTITIPFTASAEGTTITTTPLTNTTISASTNNYIKIATDGASTTAAKLFISVKAKVIE